MRSLCSGATRPNTVVRATSRSSAASSSPSRAAPRHGLAGVEPGLGGERGDGAGVVAGKHLERHAVPRKRAIVVGGLGAQLVGERDDRDRLQRRAAAGGRGRRAVSRAAERPPSTSTRSPRPRAVGEWRRAGRGRRASGGRGRRARPAPRCPSSVVESGPAQRGGERPLVAHGPPLARRQRRGQRGGGEVRVADAAGEPAERRLRRGHRADRRAGRPLRARAARW